MPNRFEVLDGPAGADAFDDGFFVRVQMLGNEPEDRSPDHLLGGVTENSGGGLFQLVMIPLRSLLMITSSEEATIAASSPRRLVLSRSSFFCLAKIRHIPDRAEDLSFRPVDSRLKIAAQFDSAECPVGAVHETFKVKRRTLLQCPFHCFSKCIMEIRMQEIPQELRSVDWPFFPGPTEISHRRDHFPSFPGLPRYPRQIRPAAQPRWPI